MSFQAELTYNLTEHCQLTVFVPRDLYEPAMRECEDFYRQSLGMPPSQRPSFKLELPAFIDVVKRAFAPKVNVSERAIMIYQTPLNPATMSLITELADPSNFVTFLALDQRMNPSYIRLPLETKDNLSSEPSSSSSSSELKKRKTTVKRESSPSIDQQASSQSSTDQSQSAPHVELLRIAVYIHKNVLKCFDPVDGLATSPVSYARLFQLMSLLCHVHTTTPSGQITLGPQHAKLIKQLIYDIMLEPTCHVALPTGFRIGSNATFFPPCRLAAS